MESSGKFSHWQTYYNRFFVLTVTAMLLTVLAFSYSQDYEQFETNFFQKKFLIETFNHLRIKMGDRVFPRVLIEKNGWLEFTAGSGMDDFQHTISFSDNALQHIADEIKSCNEYAQKHNISFLIVVAPNKVSIYPDQLPEQIQPLSGQTRLDQLNKYLRAQNIPEILDLRPALRMARQQHDVYYKTDTHWNSYGAYIAYQEIISKLAQNYPGLRAYSAQSFRFHETTPKLHDLANIIEAKFITEPDFVPERQDLDFVQRMELSDTYGYNRIAWIPEKQAPTLLLFHDSFGYLLRDFLELHFSTTYSFHRASAFYSLNSKNLEQFHPDILLFEVVERDLGELSKDLADCASK
jgi:alginate O-acetyltransferase complex protein AlgJ